MIALPFPLISPYLQQSTMAKKAPANTAAPAQPATKPAAKNAPKKAAAAVSVGERAKPATPPSAPLRQIDVFPNPAPQRDYVIQFQVPEFTCFCPLTGQPDFAHFTIDCIADKLCVELKSLKMYMWSYRNDGAFHEKVTNDILTDIVKAISPRFLRITAKWYVRGGIYTNVVVEHRKKGWKPAPKVDLPQHNAETGLLG
jgi:7-cyano-7-deazaguanine reductase